MKWWMQQLVVAVPTVLLIVLQNPILLSGWCVLLLASSTCEAWFADEWKRQAKLCLDGWKSSIEQNGGGE